MRGARAARTAAAAATTAGERAGAATTAATARGTGLFAGERRKIVEERPLREV